MDKIKRIAYALKLWILNNIVSIIPFWWVRRLCYVLSGTSIGSDSNLNMRLYLLGVEHLNVGRGTHINQGCILDARGGLRIGNNVSISHRVMILTGSHDVQSNTFEQINQPIVIGDYVWVGAGATILQGVTIGDGAVVAAGAVVTKDVSPYDVVAGVPAKKIGARQHNLNYHCYTTNILM